VLLNGAAMLGRFSFCFMVILKSFFSILMLIYIAFCLRATSSWICLSPYYKLNLCYGKRAAKIGRFIKTYLKKTGKM
jgi:hypothetical protein